MLRFTAICVALCVSSSAFAADKPSELRPITEADSVLAVYRQDWGRRSNGTPAIILAAWPDGHIIWSGERLKGGGPYRSGHVDPKHVTALLAQFDKDGLFDDPKLNQAHFGPDSQFITVFIKSGSKQVKMQSWHEIYEASDRRRLDVLRKEPVDYLFFRLVWSETRAKVSDLIPGEASAIAGRPIMKAGVLSWQELATTPKPDSARDQSEK